VNSIALAGACAGISLSPGSSCEIVVASGERKREVLGDMLGQIKVGVVGPDGGLISNLPLRENISLAAEFHGIGSDASRNARLAELGGQFGDDGAQLRALDHARPVSLSLYQKRLAGFLRSMLMEPELMVFDSLFEGISRAHAAKLREFKRIFHLYFPFRHVVFVNYSEEPLLQGLVEQTYRL
jgi:ABC-type multidrug transport system ATPase subunit